LEQERLIKSEEEAIEKAWALNTGENPPLIRHFLCVNRELDARRHHVARSPSMAEAPLSVDSVATAV
jgi:hypothetical protein